MIALLTGLAWAQCDGPPLSAPPEALSVAWVSPMSRRARGRSWLYVVPTTELRAWAEAQGQGQGQGEVTRTLQWLGLRRSSKEPRRQYKVVVFDTRPELLCRPIVSEEAQWAGAPTCDYNQSGRDGAYEGCGWATDQATGQPSIPVFRGQWEALAVNGFCLLPLSRFLAP